MVYQVDQVQVCYLVFCNIRLSAGTSIQKWGWFHWVLAADREAVWDIWMYTDSKHRAQTFLHNDEWLVGRIPDTAAADTEDISNERVPCSNNEFMAAWGNFTENRYDISNWSIFGGPTSTQIWNIGWSQSCGDLLQVWWIHTLRSASSS